MAGIRARLSPPLRRSQTSQSSRSFGGGLSIVAPTYRQQPRFEWLVDSLASQLRSGDEVEVIFVDGRHSTSRAAELERLVAGRFEFRHVPAKPTPYNGRFRLTRREFFAAASARNTGIVYASKGYVAFVDDACVPMPEWLDEVRRAATGGYVVAGAYWKQWDMVVEDGRLASSRAEPSGRDSRWELGRDDGLVQIGGGQLYGCSCGIPRELLLKLNGYDELCDSIGGEDYHLGLRLEWSGSPIYFSRRMLTIESEELHRGEPGLLRLDKATDPHSYMRRLAEFGVARRMTDGGYDSSHLILDILYGTRSIRSIGNYYELSELDEGNLLGLVERFPHTHWFDGQPLGDL